ncbi:type III pantothenate kinase [Aestuariivivens sediminicola]|uniref:type III pantothenate kinase n=1 Tax=Aestuariivivens sediminicola TaxID=2913560 RepID=UPI001F5A94A8|nr:type III pantothenate kinase [Aestuariivivens sediminicola]
MNLVIDVGNSMVKLAVFDKDQMVFKDTVPIRRLHRSIHTISLDYPHIEWAILSSVARLETSRMMALEERFKLLKLDHSSKLPFENCYKTPETLGVDRLALVGAAFKTYPNTDVLIIDAGTCITFDFINNKNAYLGGAISPGIDMRYKALHTLTANLPLLDVKKPDSLIGNSTQGAIHSGVVHGVLKEIDGVIQAYQQKYPDLTVILTGGDAKFLSKQLKSSIFANSNFLLEGLNYLLQFNTI